MVRVPRLGVVSYFAHRRYEPRGIRTRAIVDALSKEWQIELIAGPDDEAVRTPPGIVRAGRYARYRTTRAFALDTVEPWSRRTLRKWPASVDGGLLIGYPFSAVALGARRLSARGLPYVVDVSDPWAITAPRSIRHAGNDMGAVAFRRACSAERCLWADASGAILTTAHQERALKQLFPDLPTLVRPNGFTGDVLAVAPASVRSGRDLRIGHFGNLYAPRLDMRPFLLELARSRHWDSVALEHFGGDWNHTLRRLPAEIELRVHHPVPWPEIVARSRELDVALVVGNTGGIQLPSKVIDYLTLPIPRVAICEGRDDDAISEYVREKPGWLVVGKDDRDVADRLAAHLATRWTAESLAPPESESWLAVGQEVASFVSNCLSRVVEPTDGTGTGATTDAGELPSREAAASLT